ncbi:hypothetical protein [Alkalimonas amylolytica]|uniref:Methylamine utilization protein MauE n=1 Tax=Alkalimonas amylolytica TaxID=152573 RepID=A0A1H4AWZ8_ALKAM|nr:hypothetical protein [Alkalimonas amylolytica]SEA40443.1 hypothetical protein SAMN04488051_10366 [Alkalimonas amylolytica]
MGIKKGSFIFISVFLGVMYLWVVADRLGLLGPVGNLGVVWGDFDNFLEYTATLNPWFPRVVSDILGYLVTFLEIVLGVFLLAGIRIKEAALASLSLLLVFLLSMLFSIGFKEAFDYIAFTLVVAAASALLYREAKVRKLGWL